MPSFSALDWWRSADKEPIKSSEGDVHQSSASLNSRLRQVVANQSLLAQFFKLVVIFVVALIHVFYAKDFLDVFSALEVYLETSMGRSPTPAQSYKTLFLLNLLVDYKKNLWISVGTLCVCLSISCFFIFLIKENSYKSFHVIIMRLVDMVVLLVLPALLWSRLLFVKAMILNAEDALLEASKNAQPAGLMNRLHCSVTPRERVPTCAAVLERAVFPVVLLEYLVVLCIITAAYVGLAYLIVYCIRHWFPHSTSPSSSPCHSCRGPRSSSFSAPPRYAPSSARPLLHPYTSLNAEQLA